MMTSMVDEKENGSIESSCNDAPLEIVAGNQIFQTGKQIKTPLSTSTPVTPVDDRGNGEEKIGRWSETEHKIFLEGLEKHGKQWKTISTMIGTRTVVQVRTHAQKFFQKIDRKNKTKTPDGPSAPIPAQTQGRASKRKSLPTSLPSRKKACKMASPSKHAVSRTTSMSLVNTNCSNDMPTFVSTNSLSSGNWSTVSPTGVTDFDIADTLCGMNDPQIVLEESLEPETGEGGADDPLDWLIDGGIGHLPESSLDQAPVFQDCLDLSGANFLLETENEEAKTYPVLLQEIADPKVTVQSLFLDDGDDHLP